MRLSRASQSRSGYSLLFLAFAQHRHKANRQRGAFFQLPVLLFEQIELLGESFSYGNDHTPAVSQLIHKRLWNLLRRASHDDRIERRLFGPALVTIAHFD